MSQPPTPDSSWKGLPGGLFFAFLVIGPPAAVIGFTQSLTQNPLLITGMVVVYEVLLFLMRFANDIWQLLKKPLIDHIARWITLRVQELTSRYHRRYCELLIFEHQVFDVKGLSIRSAHALGLEQVFVDVQMDPKAPQETSADLLGLPDHLCQGTHSIWDYLSSPELTHHHLVIVGAPGSGKTTLLKHIALTLAQPEKHPRPVRLRQTFPILLFLRDHARSITDNPDFSLVKALQAHTQRMWLTALPAPWLSRYLEKGLCLIMLDGLDEVADETTRKQVVDWVQRQLLAHGRNRFVFTSRPYGYRENPLEGVTVLQLQPFTLNQVEQFVRNWYLANELKSWGKVDPGVHLRAREGAQDLLRRLRQSPALLALAINPLLLTMIVTVHRPGAFLPGKRVELYAEICKVFLGKRREALGVTQDLSPDQKQKVLQPLAFHLMQREKTDITIDEAQQIIAPYLVLVNAQMTPIDFLQLVENTSGLLLERNPGIYVFAHLTFQEYLAAVHIKEKGLERVLVAQVATNWWHETIRLYCAQADATALIMACLAGDPPDLAALTLAFECDEEKFMIQPQAQAQLDTVLETGVEDPDPKRRNVHAEALLIRRLRHMVHLRGQTYIDTELVSCAEYQLFLDEQGERQPDHWQTASFSQGQGLSPVLGVRFADAQAFCAWLTERFGGLWHYRLLIRDEIISTDGRELIPLHITATTGYWIEDGTVKIQTYPYTLDAMSVHLRKRIEDDPAQTGDLSGASANDLAKGLARARYSSRECYLNRSITIIDDLARDFTNTDILARDLAHASVSTYVIATGLSSASANDLAKNLAHAQARTHSLISALNRDRAKALGRAFDLSHVYDISLILSLALDLVAVLNVRIREPSAQERQATTDLLYIRRTAMTLARSLRQYILNLNLRRTRELEDLEFAIESYIDLALTIALLEERIEGRLPAWEGILLTKEFRTTKEQGEL